MPLYSYALFWLGLILGVTIVLSSGYRVGLPWAWFLPATCITCLAYGFDKLAARSKWMRVPESILLVLAFLGGTLGALAGMLMFHHKTVKESFRRKFWLVVLAQIAVAVAGLVIQARWNS